MRLLLLFALATLLALTIQTVLPRLLPWGILTPNLVLILVVDLAMRHPRALSALMAFAMGYALDAFSGTALGLNALMLTLIFALVYWLSRSVVSGGTVVSVFAVFTGVILADFGSYLLSSGLTPPGSVATLMPPVLVQAGITALLAPVAFRLMGWAVRSVGLPAAALSG